MCSSLCGDNWKNLHMNLVNFDLIFRCITLVSFCVAWHLSAFRLICTGWFVFLCVCVLVFVSGIVFVCVYMSRFVCVCVCVCLYVSIGVCVCVCVYTQEDIWLSKEIPWLWLDLSTDTRDCLSYSFVLLCITIHQYSAVSPCVVLAVYYLQILILAVSLHPLVPSNS